MPLLQLPGWLAARPNGSQVPKLKQDILARLKQLK